MAVVVTKQGALPSHDVFAGTCRVCSTEVEFLRGDAKLTFDQRDGDFLSVTCPTCSATINVNASSCIRRATPPARPSR